MAGLFENDHKNAGKTDSRMNGTMHTIGDVCRVTGIEPSRVRFIEREFKEYFAGGATFDARQVELFRKIHQLLFVENQSPFMIRRQFSNDLRRLKIIAVTSGKGGVGKTTLSLNLAIAMAARGQRTLLLDADMGLGNVHVFAGIAPRGSLMDLIDGRLPAEKLLTQGPGGIQVLCGNSGSARMADLSPEIIGRMEHELAALGGKFDVLIIDTGAGISSQVTRFLAMADKIVVVTTPNIAATLDAYGIIKVMREQAMRGHIHLLVNQADGDAQAQAVSEKLRACSERFLQYPLTVLGSVMRDAKVEETNQSRKPLVLSQPDHPNAKVIAQIAGNLCPPATPQTPASQTQGDDFETMRVLKGIATTVAA